MDISRLTAGARKAIPSKRCGAVIVAAGNASRMEGIDKVMAQLGGEPMIRRTVRIFQQSSVISEIVIVTRPDLIVPIGNLCSSFSKVKAVVSGGATRPESVHNGLNALSSKVKLAAIQDGARPLITEEVIDRTVRAAQTYGAAAPGIPLKDTIKIVQGGVVTETPERKLLQAVQTPQVFDFDLLRGALLKAEREGAELTDDCSAVERMGVCVRMVPGDERNIKVTTPMDLKIAELFLEEQK